MAMISPRGRFQIRRKSRRDRRWAKLREIKDEPRRRIMQPILAQGRWLKLVITGLLGLPRRADQLSVAWRVP
jgi:hypothetical protein